MFNDKTKYSSGLTLIALSTPILLAGCATTATPEKLDESRSKLINENGVDLPRQDKVKVHSQPYVDSTPIAYRKGSENLVDVSSNGSQLSDALQGPSSALGYSISFTSGTNHQAPVFVHLNDVGALDAINKIAESVGYVAVVDEHANNITITDKATWVLRVPPSLFDINNTNFSVGTNSGESEGSEDVSGSQGSSSSAFNINGESTSDDRGVFEENIKRMLAVDADDARATFSWTTGTISIEGDVFTLNRVKKYIDEMVRHSLTQVEVKTTIAQVRLSDEQSYGINWNNLLSSASIEATISGGANNIANPAFSATTTKHSVEAIVNAVSENNNISILSSPSLLTKNNRPATIFNGSKIPYLPEIELSTEEGVTTTGAEAAYAAEGLSLSVIPSALDNNTVSLKLIPSLTDLGEFRVFEFQNNEDGARLEVPEIFQRQLYIDVTAQSGETIILGGTRTSSKDRARNGVPGIVNSTNVISKLFGGVQNSDQEEELVVLVRANIIPAPQFNSLVSQSL